MLVSGGFLATPAGIALKHTPLYQSHRAAGARMVEFGGWEMPVEYSGIIREHLAVRTAAGLFDVSHMGEIDVRGPGALRLLQYVTSNDVSRLSVGQAQYTALMYPRGSAVDDCILHKLEDEHYFLCVNAANTDKDFSWIQQHNAAFGAETRNVSADYAQVALQGPRAPEILKNVCSGSIADIRHYWLCRTTCCGVEGLLARTGYTGEDGFEFYFSPEESQQVWDILLDAGKPDGLVPAGLGARNTLRLEAGYPLYGNELDEETTLLEASLAWIAKLEKGDFLGRGPLLEQKQRGVSKRLIGFEMTDRGIARDGYAVAIDGKFQGRVTSGAPAPYLKKNIGMAYLPPDYSTLDREIQIEIRGKFVPARVVPLPFYKRPR
jgi:aminomethyltransferase